MKKRVIQLWSEIAAHKKRDFKKSVNKNYRKVDLNMVREVQDKSSEANSTYASAVNSISQAIQEIDSAIKMMERVIELAQGAVKTGEEVERLTDHLGAQLDSSVVQSIQEAFNVQQAAEQNLKDLNKAKQVIL